MRRLTVLLASSTVALAACQAAHASLMSGGVSSDAASADISVSGASAVQAGDSLGGTVADLSAGAGGSEHLFVVDALTGLATAEAGVSLGDPSLTVGSIPAASSILAASDTTGLTTADSSNAATQDNTVMLLMSTQGSVASAASEVSTTSSTRVPVVSTAALKTSSGNSTSAAGSTTVSATAQGQVNNLSAPGGAITPAPEPGTLGLIGVGLAGLLARRKRVATV